MTKTVAAGDLSPGNSSEILTRAGIYSYSIYMVHTLMIGMMVAFLTALMRLGMPILGIPKLYILDIPKTLGTAMLIVFIGGLWYVARATYDRIERPGQTVLPDFVARLARRKPNLTY
jgi:peptidoglycan/LPS O-acetylase OafA/YrhL